MSKLLRLSRFIQLLGVLLLTSCAQHGVEDPRQDFRAYGVEGESLLAVHAPVFVVENPDEEYNLPGTAVAAMTETGEMTAVISPAEPSVYGEVRTWQGGKGEYKNLVYRINFSESPFEMVPFNIGAGKNMGLFVIVTLDQKDKPILYTTVHTCGCYLAFIPTEDLPRKSYPVIWPEKRQDVYGENLPAYLPRIESDEQVYITIRETTHRVADIYRHSEKKKYTFPYEEIDLRPLAGLQRLDAGEGRFVSLFETEGPRKDYVVDSQKIWERVLISWWALDRRVGEDKRLGRDTGDGIVFYTSLKPWDREESDLRDFPQFLGYWGWRL